MSSILRRGLVESPMGSAGSHRCTSSRHESPAIHARYTGCTQITETADTRADWPEPGSTEGTSPRAALRPTAAAGRSL